MVWGRGDRVEETEQNDLSRNFQLGKKHRPKHEHAWNEHDWNFWSVMASLCLLYGLEIAVD